MALFIYATTTHGAFTMYQALFRKFGIHEGTKWAKFRFFLEVS